MIELFVNVLGHIAAFAVVIGLIAGGVEGCRECVAERRGVSLGGPFRRMRPPEVGPSREEHIPAGATDSWHVRTQAVGGGDMVSRLHQGVEMRGVNVWIPKRPNGVRPLIVREKNEHVGFAAPGWQRKGEGSEDNQRGKESLHARGGGLVSLRSCFEFLKVGGD